jgi:ATP-dependent helicase YprA (DUF1998 family)
MAVSSSSTSGSHRQLAFVARHHGFHHSTSIRDARCSHSRNACHGLLDDRLNGSLVSTRCRTHRDFHRLFASSSSLDASSSTNAAAGGNDGGGFFAGEDVTFESVGVRSPVLLERLRNRLALTRPTQIQAKAFAKIRGDGEGDVHAQGGDERRRKRSTDVTIGAETGSGKTLAYLLPLMDDILTTKAERSKNGSLSPYDYARAVVLVPNKELVQQVLRMAVPLCGGTARQSVVTGASSGKDFLEQLELLATNQPHEGDEPDPNKIVRLAILPGGLNEPLDFKPFRDSVAFGGTDQPVDIVVATPASLGPLGLKPNHIDMFADIRTLVVDEADMLLGMVLALR